MMKNKTNAVDVEGYSTVWHAMNFEAALDIPWSFGLQRESIGRATAKELAGTVDR